MTEPFVKKALRDQVQLAHDLFLPANAVTQTFGFIARKGGGKTYAAGKLVEELARIGAPVIILDPVGNWYGLRLAADGKKPGLSIPVFGGEHGDIAIQATQGERVSKLLIERNLSAVIDVSAFRKNERKRFAADFGEALYNAAKKNRAPRMVVFEEAQVFMPQNPGPDDRKMLGAFEDIVRLGRNCGLGSTLISQRPQSVNKEVLNQVEALFVGQLSGPQERKAIELWCKERDSDRSALEELPGLKTGTMVLWSPQWLTAFRKVQIGTKWTFDASATPVLGQKLEKALSLADIDVGSLRAALEDKKPEPKKAAETSAFNTRDTAKLAALELENKALRVDLREAEKDRQRLRAQLSGVLSGFQRVETDLKNVTDKMKGLLEHPSMQERAIVRWPKHVDGTQFENPHSPDTTPPPAKPAARVARSSNEEPLRAGAVKMLKVLAAFYPGLMTKPQIARAADMKVTGGTFGSYWSNLKRQDLIEQPGTDLYKISAEGLQYLGADRPETPKNLEARIAFWSERLRAGERLMLDLVREHGPISREMLAELAEMTAQGGTFGSYLSTLKTNRLIAKDSDGSYVLHEWLLKGGQ